MKKIRLILLFYCFIIPVFGQLPDEDQKLLQAAYEGNESKLLQALINKADIEAVTDKGVSALIYASQRGFDNIVKILVYNGANISHTANDGVNAFLAASMLNRISIADYLLKSGADINSVNKSGAGALHFCAAYNYDSLCRFLIEKKANPEFKDIDGNTPLMIAAFSGNNTVISILVEAKAQIDNPDKNGFTPLMASINRGYLNTAQFLIRQNANVSAVNNNKLNAAGIAVLSDHLAALPLLKNDLKKTDTAAIDPFRIAYAKMDINAVRKLKKAGFKSFDKVLFPSFFTLVGLNFNADHLLFNFKAGVHEVVNNFDVFADYQVRLFRKKIWVNVAPGVEYQYWESRSFAGIGISKDFFPFGEKNKHLLFLQTSFSYSYGNFRATYKKAESFFVIIPAVGLKYFIDNSSNIQFVLSYCSYQPNQIFPLHLGINLQSYFPFSNKKLPDLYKLKQKHIDWLY